MEKLNEVVLSLGSNIENRLDYLKRAVNEISENLGEVQKISPIYESESVGFQAEVDFLNLCLLLKTHHSALDILRETQAIERKLGRTSKTRHGYTSREIDIDIIFFNDEIIQLPDLEVPHPHYSQRKFVLLPLKDVVCEYIAPITSECLEEKIKVCKDASKISVTSLLI